MAETDREPSHRPLISARKRSSKCVAPLRRWDCSWPTPQRRGCRRSHSVNWLGKRPASPATVFARCTAIADLLSRPDSQKEDWSLRAYLLRLCSPFGLAVFLHTAKCQNPPEAWQL